MSKTNKECVEASALHPLPASAAKRLPTCGVRSSSPCGCSSDDRRSLTTVGAIYEEVLRKLSQEPVPHSL
ncbi:hypothetical protein EVAR_41239_1 [Eumeta japonica]|uniref:Uncharacterized protein n=1 Tax=Eumeta variegata TaxID=151549 RepID=A0A4C1W760_EUMVA|nr:hypothetical protein EVAR_41239_1 [Eumeta japonica]